MSNSSDISQTTEAGKDAAVTTSGSTSSDPASPSLEDLQQQLTEMEAAQSELASRLQQQESSLQEPQLDSGLAAIEEQFRQSFDDRLRSTALPRAAVRRGLDLLPGGTADTTDILMVNRVFREVSRLMGDEWRPVFETLMAPLPPDVVETAKQNLQQQPALIQGYRGLLAWREASGGDFDIRRLLDVLRTCDMDDIADAAIALLENRSGKDDRTKPTKPVQRRKSDVSSRSKTGILDNRRMLLLAKKVGGDWESLGKALGVPDEEIEEIKESDDGATYQGAFKMLWSWRQTQTAGNEEASNVTLRSALQSVNKSQFMDQISAN